MELLRTFDAKDYGPRAKRILRSAVRAIILRDGKAALIRSERYGEYKFPGGGAEEGESHAETLAREVREETGLTLRPDSIRPYGTVRQIHRDRQGDGIFDHTSHYYRCAVEEGVGETALDPYEAEYGYRLVFVPLEEAVAANEARNNPDNPPWVERDLFVMKRLLAESAGQA